MKETSRGSFPAIPRRRGLTLGLVAAAALLAGPGLLGQTVSVPLEKYDQLRARAYPRPVVPAKPDPGVSFESVELALSVGDERVRVEAVASLWLHGDGWQAVDWPADWPLLALRAPTGEARVALDGATRRLEIRGRPGRHRVEIEASLPLTRDVTATRPTSSLHVPLPEAARVVGTIATGDNLGEVTAGDSVWLERTGPRAWRFAGRPGESAWFTLAGALAAATAERPLRFEVTTATALALQRTRRQAEVWLTGQVIEGRLERLTIPAPAGFEVVSVDGVEGLGWDVKDGRLEIGFPGPAPASWSLVVTLAADTADESAVPLLLPEGARRTFVVTKAEARGGGILERADDGAGRGLEPNEANRLPAEFVARVGEPLVVAAGAAAPRWRVTWPQETQVLGAQVDRLLVDVLVGEHGRAYYQIWAVVRANGAPDLGLELPGTARLVDARRDGARARLGQRGAAWVSPLVSRDSAQILFWAAEVDLAWPQGGSGRLEIPIPALSSPISTVEVRAGVPGAFRYEWVDPSRRGAIGPPPSLAAERAGENLLARQLQANARLIVSKGESGGFQPLPAGFRWLEATWSTLDTAPSPLVLTVRPAEEVRR